VRLCPSSEGLGVGERRKKKIAKFFLEFIYHEYTLNSLPHATERKPIS
jgi:hypothetical protein